MAEEKKQPDTTPEKPVKKTAKRAAKETAKTPAQKKTVAKPAAKAPEPATAAKEEKAGKPAKAKAAAKPKEPAFRFEEEGEIGFLIFDMPGKSVNILTRAVASELDAMLDELMGKTHLKALIIMSGKKGTFIAGVDVNEIKDITDPAEGEKASHEGHRLYNKLAALPYPTIALIDGACVGGGFELALACDYRLARQSGKTKIGLPEIKLGIFPGWGGSQRLPRLISLQKALDYILSGRLVDAKRAYRDGLVDRLIPAEFSAADVRQAAIAFVDEIQAPASRERIKKRRKKGNLQTALLEKNPLGRKVLFDQARKKTAKATHGNYPAPLKALEAVEKGYDKSLPEGLAIEAKLLGECIVTAVSKNLIHIFWMTEELKKDLGVEGFSGEVRKFDRIGILGAGVMGGGIAQLMAHNNHPVRMKDINLAAVAKGMEQASKVFNESVKRRRLKPKDMRKKMGLISGTTDYSGLEKVDLVIEAVVENMEVKKKVFAEVDAVVPAHAVLASNTSSLSVTEMASATQRPEKVAGMHFFNPVHRMPLVEIIRGEQSADETIASLVAFSRELGKTAIVVKDSPGFLVNRILAPYMNEAATLLQEGQAIEHIDKAILKFGMPMGPLTLYDEVGIDVTYKVAKILEAAFGDLMQASPIIEKMYEAQRFGKKTRKGFYAYQGKERKPDAAVYKLLGIRRENVQLLSETEVQERCILLMANEAVRCLEEGVARNARDVDVGMIFGTGFPPFRGGLLKYVDSLGVENVAEKLTKLAERYGERFVPTSMLQEMARKKQRFFA